MAQINYGFNWPPWAESWVDLLSGEVHISVEYGQFGHTWTEAFRKAALHIVTQRITQ